MIGSGIYRKPFQLGNHSLIGKASKFNSLPCLYSFFIVMFYVFYLAN